jgi:hypothetical protein
MSDSIENTENKETKVLGYNPNRDSGIAAARGYIEIPKDSLPSGLIQEYGFVPEPTQRYFAQLVYNVGSGGMNGGMSESDAEKFEQLKGLIPYIEYIKAAAGIQLKELVIDYAEVSGLISSENSLETKNTPVPVTVDEKGKYEVVLDTDNIDKIQFTDILINVEGYVSSTECYVWEQGYSNTTIPDSAVSDKTVRFLAATTYTPPSTENPFGVSTIYLNSNMWESIGKLPVGKQIIKIFYLQLPKLLHSGNFDEKVEL